jgi:drug/metabolite transporter (DMT)-like permease
MQALAASSALVLFVIVCVAIWNRGYQDTLVQRAGLVLAALGCVFVLWTAVTGRPLDNALVWTLLGCSVFAVGTLIKRVQAHRAGKVST